MCSMAPTDRTLRTMVAVFPHVLDFHAPSFSSFVVGSAEPLRFEPEALRGVFADERGRERLSAAGELDGTRATLERWLAEVEVVSIDGDRRADYAGDLNTDLFPRDEFDVRYAGDYR